jgi:GWxTD domain-containing protein
MWPRAVALTIACSILLPSICHAGEAVGRGEFEFFLDAAAFRMADGSTRQDIYLRLPNVGVRFKEAEGRLQAITRVTIVIRDANGEAVVKDGGEFKMHADEEALTTDPVKFHTLTKSYSLAEGVYKLSCAIQDLNSPKVTVLGMIRKKYNESVVRGYPLEVPTFPEDKMSFSDAKFLWSVGTEGDEQTYVPNPSRLYGLRRDSLRVYLEAYVPRSIASSTDLNIKTVILNEKGEQVTQSSVAAPRASATRSAVATYPILVTNDLNRFMAGGYSLYVSGGATDPLPVRIKAGSFSVAWDMRTWEQTRRHLIAEARFLLEEKDFKGFTSKSVGEQEAIVQNMWKELDPDPATGVNEAYEEFMERLAYVNVKYTDYQLGMLTDRGLIYLKYGPPDERIVDVIPLNRESMSDALQKVEDRYHPVNFSNTGGRMGYAKPQQNIVVDPRRLGAVGEEGNTAYPYELWIYNQSGDPIRKRDRNLEPDHGLRFIFVDREGYGRYRPPSRSYF